MKLYSRVSGCELIDSFVFRNKTQTSRTVGLLIPLGKRAMMVFLRDRRKLYCSFPYMRREDAIKAALARHDKVCEHKVRTP